MENAGKLVEDEELAEAMKAKGLGTPATRASVIEGLIFEDYVHRNGRELQPTAKAFDLLYAIEKFGIDELRSPELTGDWEFKLKQIEQGKLPADAFMDPSSTHARSGPRAIRQHQHRRAALDATRDARSAGAWINENYKKFQCASCDFAIWKVIAGRRIENEEVEQLIREGAIGPLQGFRSRIGRPFAAMLKLRDDFTAQLDFGQSGQDERRGTVDFTGRQPLGVPRRRRPCSTTSWPTSARSRWGRRHLRLSHRENHSAAPDRARAGDQAARRRQDRPPAPLHLQEGAAVLRLPRAPARRPGRIRVRPARRCQGEGGAEARSGADRGQGADTCAAKGFGSTRTRRRGREERLPVEGDQQNAGNAHRAPSPPRGGQAFGRCQEGGRKGRH
jgi:hypothetical protein